MKVTIGILYNKRVDLPQMNETHRRLVTTYPPAENGSIPRSTVQSFLAHPERNHVPAKVLYEEMPPEVKDMFTSGKGNLKEKKYRKFLRSLDVLLEEFTEQELLMISDSCIDKDGSINLEGLKAIWKDEDGD